MQPPSAEIAETFGGSADGFAARQLTPEILRETDIVLAMASSHRGEVLQLDASLLKRTFTIREFARLLGALEERDAQGDGPAVTEAADVGSLWRGLPARLASRAAPGTRRGRCGQRRH